MGFNDQEIVALSGAHAVGRCHEDASGFWGPWTRAEVRPLLEAPCCIRSIFEEREGGVILYVFKSSENNNNLHPRLNLAVDVFQRVLPPAPRGEVDAQDQELARPQVPLEGPSAVRERRRRPHDAALGLGASARPSHGQVGGQVQGRRGALLQGLLRCLWKAPRSWVSRKEWGGRGGNRRQG